MKLIKSDSNQCVLASFAMAMGLDMKYLEKQLGHDGKAIVVKEEYPACYRSYHPQEFIDLILGWEHACTMIELHPCLQHGKTLVNHAAFIGENRFFQSLLRGSGVIFGQIEESKTGHAVAWDSKTNTIYDPRGRTYQWTEGQDFTPRQFFLIQKVEA